MLSLSKFKPEYHQSNLVNYFDCPEKFRLSMKYSRPTTDAMRDGRLLESWVLGFKDSDDEKELVGKKTSKTLDPIKSVAEKIKPIFVKGDSYVKLKYENDEFCLAGEADFIGSIEYKKNRWESCIADLKFTMDIERIWGEKEKKSEFLQAVTYPYIYWKQTGEILPFVYIIVENKPNFPIDIEPLIRVIEVNITEEDFVWFEGFLNTVHEDILKEPNLNSCVSGPYWNVRCPYLPYCPSGRKLIERKFTINFSELNN